MDRRAAILAQVRAAAAGLEVPPPVAPPASRTRELTNLGLIELFMKMAMAAGASVDRVADTARVPHAVTDHLSAAGRPLRVRAAPSPWLRALPWDRRPSLTVTFGRARAGDQVGVSTALAGVAETGTLVIPSGADQATGLLHLPRIHIVILPLHHIVGTIAEAWHGLAIRQEARGLGMPCTIDLVTGASGPARLHVILVGGPDTPLP